MRTEHDRSAARCCDHESRSQTFLTVQVPQRSTCHPLSALIEVARFTGVVGGRHYLRDAQVGGDDAGDVLRVGAELLGEGPARPAPPAGRSPPPTPTCPGPASRTWCSGTPSTCCASIAATATSPRCRWPGWTRARRWCRSPPSAPHHRTSLPAADGARPNGQRAGRPRLAPGRYLPITHRHHALTRIAPCWPRSGQRFDRPGSPGPSARHVPRSGSYSSRLNRNMSFPRRISE